MKEFYFIYLILLYTLQRLVMCSSSYTACVEMIFILFSNHVQSVCGDGYTAAVIVRCLSCGKDCYMRGTNLYRSQNPIKINHKGLGLVMMVPICTVPLNNHKSSSTPARWGGVHNFWKMKLLKSSCKLHRSVFTNVWNRKVILCSTWICVYIYVWGTIF